MRVWIAGTLGLLMVWGRAPAQEPVPVGEEFQVNAYTSGYQRVPTVAAAPSGEFVVVWSSDGSYGSDTSYHSVQAQRFDAVGDPVGGQFQVNTYTTFEQWLPSVAIGVDGSFVVVWQSFRGSGQDTNVQGQLFDASGDAIGDEFQVNTYTTSRQFNPSVAAALSGEFVVVWTSLGSYGSDTSYGSVQAQRFDAVGEPVGGQFQVNSYTTSSQGSPSVAVESAGGFVVVWGGYGYGTDSDGGSIQAQRFDGVGDPVGGEFQVNTYTTSNQDSPSVAFNEGGEIVVVWRSFGSDTSAWSSIQGQRYDSAGAPLGEQFQVDTYFTIMNGTAPSVDFDASGDFLVSWAKPGSYGTDTDAFSVQARQYDSSGVPVGGQFQINSYTTGDQESPAVASNGDGEFVVVWVSYGSYGTDSDNSSIQGQRLSTAIFSDGFESGDTSAWSSTVP